MKSTKILLAAILPLAFGACAGGEAADADAAGTPAQESGAAAAPAPGEAEYVAFTAAWTDAAVEGCGRTLKETLGTRDLVQGALDGVSDPAGKATAELEDARHWLGLGNQKLEEVRPQLEAGACEPAVTLGLDEAVQFYVKAGTSAVQAGQIAGS